ncbi:MAG: hypothetical protein ACYTE6_02610, partial [Planctomycetota bacterium]
MNLVIVRPPALLGPPEELFAFGLSIEPGKEIHPAYRHAAVVRDSADARSIPEAESLLLAPPS